MGCCTCWNRKTPIDRQLLYALERAFSVRYAVALPVVQQLLDSAIIDALAPSASRGQHDENVIVVFVVGLRRRLVSRPRSPEREA